METQSISLNVHPQILDLYEVLEKNGLHKQKEDVQSLVGYIESMEYNLSVMMNEIQEMHAEVNLPVSYTHLPTSCSTVRGNCSATAAVCWNGWATRSRWSIS